MSNIIRSLNRAMLTGSASLIVMATAHAQTEAQDEIVVTAQKRTERLLDVPLAVTAINGDALNDRQIFDTNTLVQAVPALNFQQGNNPTNSSFRIRGVGTSLFNQGVEASVSVVVDGVVSARQVQSFTDFSDIERVEVLRGPQGTLFGKNASAGVINVVTARPSKTFEGRASVTVAEGDEYRLSSTVSGPITDTLRARITGYYNDVGGHIYNAFTQRNENGFDSWGVRGKLEWDATDRLNLLLAADYRQNNADCCQGVLVSVGNPQRLQLIGNTGAGANNRQSWNNGATFADSEQKTVSLEANLDLGGATLTSITAWQKYDIANNFEPDRLGSSVPIFVTAGGAGQFDYNYGTTGIEQFSQEVRAASNGNGPISYVVGAYYSDLHIDRAFSRRRAVCATGTFGQPCTPSGYQSLAHFAALDSYNVSGFGQAEWTVVGGLKLIGGLRVQYEKVTVGGQRTGPMVAGDGNFGGAASVYAARSANDTAVTGKAGAQYAFSRNAQVYASYTRGYKGLGFDTESGADFANQAPVLPEHVDAYEVGFKGRTADGTLTVAVAAFLADYTNLQIQANRSDPILQTIQFVQTNAGSSRTKGFEVEATVRPSRHFSLTGSVSYTDASINVDGLNCPTQFQAAAPTVGVGGVRPVNSCYRYQYLNGSGTTVTSGPVQDVRGGQLPASPKWRISLSPRFEHELGDALVGFIQTDLTFQSDQIFAVEQDPLGKQDGYAIVDLSAGFKTADGKYSLTTFVKNLFDQNYYTSLSGATLNAASPTLIDLYANVPKGASRYVGATASVRF
ncbi:TonB-dependent receptor [Sphingobium sufflavum]|uniref:TonB-dependent receptor n=1 Tax=Sphingobium sufflavum TaxID=1129547 RepID=UPI001F27DF7F|nr:TonB-dependent receptor [Sphingobium sufflavum]MCE7796398.1 TonB-dependent receptor [Sphingobium sufflavum]